MVKKNIMNMFIDGSCIYKLFLSANSTNSYSKIFIFIWSHEHYNRQDPQDKPFEYITMKRIQSDKHKLYTVEQKGYPPFLFNLNLKAS